MNGKKVKLNGIERLCTVSENSNYKIAIVISLNGPVDLLVSKMPTAFTKVFNKHPRMRSLMSKDTPFTAVIQDYVTIDDVLPLISAVNVVGDEWKQMIELECNVPFKRDIQLPYFIRIYKQDERNAKMVIYADHYMSDGTSAFIIINDILTSVCNPNADLPEQKLTDSIYAMKCSPIRRWCEKTLMKCLRPLISHRTKSYQPLFPIDKSQGDYSVPIPRNPSGALFADGSAENMKSAIQNCKKHSVSVNSAVMVALLIAAVKTKFDEDTSKCNNFKMALDCAYDLRRGSPKTKDLQVGAFANSTVLLGYKSKGVDLDKNFWSECTRAKKETIKAYGLLTLTSACFDVYLGRNCGKSVFDGQKGCIVSDVNISNVGKCPFPTTYQLGSDVISINGLYGHTTSSHLSAGINLCFVGITHFTYTMSYKFDPFASKTFFNNFVNATESIGSISKSESIRDVLNRIYN